MDKPEVVGTVTRTLEIATQGVAEVQNDKLRAAIDRVLERGGQASARYDRYDRQHHRHNKG